MSFLAASPKVWKDERYMQITYAFITTSSNKESSAPARKNQRGSKWQLECSPVATRNHPSQFQLHKHTRFSKAPNICSNCFIISSLLPSNSCSDTLLENLLWLTILASNQHQAHSKAMPTLSCPGPAERCNLGISRLGRHALNGSNM